MDYKVLVVDDETVTLELMKDIISRVGCHVDVAERGADAVELIDREDYGLIITDIKMPGMSGLDVLKHARRKNPDCLVVLFTGYATLETAIEAIKAGAYDYITKPFTADEVLVVLKNAWERILLGRKNQRLLDELGSIYDELKNRDCRVRAQDASEGPPKDLPAQPITYNGRLLSVREPIQAGWSESLDEIKGLAQLKRDGFITTEEFENFKGRILGNF